LKHDEGAIHNGPRGAGAACRGANLRSGACPGVPSFELPGYSVGEARVQVMPREIGVEYVAIQGQPRTLQRAIDSLTDELVSLWAPLFAPKDWPQRLELLKDVHEQLQDDIGDLEFYSAVSPVFIRKLINELQGGPVTSTAQAHIYANSEDHEHRRAAGEWLSKHAGA
jgi:hypothetical protein